MPPSRATATSKHGMLWIVIAILAVLLLMQGARLTKLAAVRGQLDDFQFDLGPVPVPTYLSQPAPHPSIPNPQLGNPLPMPGGSGILPWNPAASDLSKCYAACMHQRNLGIQGMQIGEFDLGLDPVTNAPDLLHPGYPGATLVQCYAWCELYFSNPSSEAPLGDMNTPDQWGTLVERDLKGHHSVYIRDLGNGEKVVTFVEHAM